MVVLCIEFECAVYMWVSIGALEERKAQGESLCNLAYAYSQMKNYKTAALYYQEALQAFKDVGKHLTQPRS